MKPFCLCAGIPRSGSTWLFNVSRLIYIQHYSNVYSCWVGDFIRLNMEKASVTVVKTHDFNNKNLLSYKPIILMSRRDLRDIVASHILKGWMEPRQAIKKLQWMVRVHQQYQPYINYEIEYADLLNKPLKLITDIAQILDLSCNPQQIYDATLTLKQADKGEQYNKQTLLHHQHHTRRVCGYYKEVLSPALIKNIETTFEDWLRKWGYM